MRYPDPGLLEAATKQLIEAGIEEGHIAKLREINPHSVVAMARLRSCALADAGVQLPQGLVEFPITDGDVRALFENVYLADALQELELDVIYGALTGPTVRLVSDTKDRGVEQIISSNGRTCRNGEAPEHRPITATMAILTILSRDSRFADFVRSHMAVPSGVIEGGRVVNEVKTSAAEKAREMSTALAVGAA